MDNIQTAWCLMMKNLIQTMKYLLLKRARKNNLRSDSWSQHVLTQ